MHKKVLIVDDSDSGRYVVSSTLINAGYEVVQAVNGKDALEKIDGAKIGVVSTDLNMPEVNGIELTKQLRGTAEHRSTPVIILSAESSRAHWRQQVNECVWIEKPFNCKKLVDIVRKLEQ